MTVTFSPEYRPGDRVYYELVCGMDDKRIGLYADPGYARRIAAAHGDVCTDPMCEGYGAGVRNVTPWPVTAEVNFANVNTFYLLGLLGLNAAADDGDRPGPFDCGDLSGSCPADDFLGRVLLAQALAGEDVGVPAYRRGGEGEGEGATVWDCGRRPGYADEALAGLAAVARWCQLHGRSVQWC